MHSRNWLRKIGRRCRISNSYVREFIAELVGTFLMMVMGIASVAQWVLHEDRGLATQTTVFLGFSIGVASGITVSAGVSGGHINPAISIMMAVIGYFPWKKVPVYVMAQMIGAFLACPVVYFNILDDLNALDNGTRHVVGSLATAHIFATYPGPNNSIATCVYDQVVSCFLLGFIILGMLDHRNKFSCTERSFPFLTGWLILALLCGFLNNTGLILNPARDLPPRLFTLLAGWGLETFSIRNYGYFWIGIVIPPVGCTIGGIMYQCLFVWHWSDDEDDDDDGNEDHDVENSSNCKKCDVSLKPTKGQLKEKTEKLT